MTSKAHRTPARVLMIACSLMLPGIASAQGFSALVSPPRFEDSAQAGTTYRNVVEISNVSERSAHFTVKTADWSLTPDNAVQFSEALAPASCRPWVGIEATEITIGPNSKRRYRFEVAIPAGTASGECRFAIMIEGDPENVAGGAAVPVSGRIGVIVYLTIGDAAAALEITAHKVLVVDGREVPVLSVRNSGNAHGRMQGFVDGSDADGRRYAFAPATFPVLPGETRDIALAPQGDDDDTPAPALAYPLQLKGRLDWGKQRLDIESTFTK
ncbi:MAG: hypothetical protein ACREO8_04565 [Luteimonas sp.]